MYGCDRPWCQRSHQEERTPATPLVHTNTFYFAVQHCDVVVTQGGDVTDLTDVERGHRFRSGLACHTWVSASLSLVGKLQHQDPSRVSCLSPTCFFVADAWSC